MHAQYADTLRTVDPEEERRQILAAEQRWPALLKKVNMEWLDKRAKTYKVLYKYTFATRQVYGYINLGDGMGHRELSEIEYRVLRKYMKNQ